MSVAPNPSDLVIRGVIDRVTFRNAQNGYVVFKMTPNDGEQPVTVVGTCASPVVGTHVIVRGKFLDHPKFGRQFAAQSVTGTTPSTPDGLKRYLGSGVVKGIGEKTAERIVDELGTDAITIILEDPKRVAKIQGVGAKKAQILHNCLKEDEENRQARQFILEHNISLNLADKIFEKYGNKAAEVVQKDPYLLARSIRGIGFTTADSIAMQVGLRLDSPERLKAGLYHSLEKSTDEGHCYLPKKLLFDQTRALLGIGDDIDLDEHLLALVAESYVIEQEDRVVLRNIDRAEDFVAQFVASRLSPLEIPHLNEEQVKSSLASASHDLGIEFSAEQEHAVITAAKHSLMLITGGPGCGKTTIIKALVRLFQDAGLKLALSAPTGRAAQRMSTVCNYPASTIHRLLKYDPIKGKFIFNASDPLPIDALIVDESSMIDIQLARDLFCAVPQHATVILVGDKDQLPSVGPGRMFGDLLSLHEVKTIALSRLFRRSKESSITTYAHNINSGVVPDIPQPDGVTKSDAYFLHRPTPEDSATLIEKLVAEQIPKKFGFSQEEILVLTPTNRGPLGTIALNKRLQSVLNPPGSIDSEQEITSGDITFRVGDRVCQRVNNYSLDPNGVFNGDVGRINRINRQNRYLEVELWDGRLIKYSEGEINQLGLAYAISVHRSQGSEIPCVVLALHESHFALLERQLVYTGITRAKKLLIVVGSRKALHIASKRARTAQRLTWLVTRVRDKLQELN